MPNGMTETPMIIHGLFLILRTVAADSYSGYGRYTEVADRDTQEMAVLFGIVTAAHIARTIGWSFPLFLRAVKLAWTYRRPKMTARLAADSLLACWARWAAKPTTGSRALFEAVNDMWVQIAITEAWR